MLAICCGVAYLGLSVRVTPNDIPVSNRGSVFAEPLIGCLGTVCES